MQFVQTYYPQEHRTPPLPLVALLGSVELHKDVGDYFIQQLRPPLVALGCTEPLEQFVRRAFGPRKQAPPSTQVAGILKADWFSKHRGRKPAVAVVLVSRLDLEGSPSAWNRMLYGLKLVSDAAAARGAGLVVAVVQALGAGELPADRVQAVAHNLALDRRLIHPLSVLPPSDGGAAAGGGGEAAATVLRQQRDASLARLGKLVLEQCFVYYNQRSREVADKAAARRAQLAGAPLPAELQARTAFKLAVYAEFRQDWATAVAHYREAYAACLQVQIGLPPRPQKWSEVCAVSELIHLKLLMLAIHQGRVDEAVQQVRAHTAHFARPPGVLPPAAACHHLGYLMRQYQVAAQEVGTKVDTMQAYSVQVLQPTGLQAALQVATLGSAAAGATGQSSLAASGPTGQSLVGLPLPAAPAAAGATGASSALGNITGVTGATAGGGSAAASYSIKDCSRPHLLMAAARLAVSRRKAGDALRAARQGHPVVVDVSAVRRGPYIGQFVLRGAGDAASGAGGGPPGAGPGPASSPSTPQLGERDYLLWLEHEELRLAVPAAAIEAMNGALLVLKDCTGVERLRSQLGGLMAAENVLANNLTAARKLLLQVCHQYRREGWDLQLLQGLTALRDVAARLRLPGEHLVYGLEMAVLACSGSSGGGSSEDPTASSEALQEVCLARLVEPAAALAACRAAVQTLLTGVSEVKQGIMKPPAPMPPGGPATSAAAAAFAAAAAASAGGSAGAGSSAGTPLGSGPASPESSYATLSQAVAGQQQQLSGHGLPRHFHYTVEYVDLREAQRRAREDPQQHRTATIADIMHRHSQQDFGWWRCVALGAGFAYGPPDPDTLDFHVALNSQLPVALPFKALVLVFADEQGEFCLQAQPGPLEPSDPPTPLLPASFASALDSATHAFHQLHLNSRLRAHAAPQDALAGGGAGEPGSLPAALADGGAAPSDLTLSPQPPGEPSGQQQQHPSPTDSRRSGYGAHASADGAPPSPTISVAGSSSCSATGGGGGSSTCAAGVLSSLPPGSWQQFCCRIAPRCVGRLRAERAVLLLSDHATVTFKLSSFPQGQPTLGGLPLHPMPTRALVSQTSPPSSAAAPAAAPSAPPTACCRQAGWDALGLPFRRRDCGGAAVAPGRLTAVVQHLGPLPSLELSMPVPVALLGEHAPLLARVSVAPGSVPLVGASMEFVIAKTSGRLQPTDIMIMVDDAMGASIPAAASTPAGQDNPQQQQQAEGPPVLLGHEPTLALPGMASALTAAAEAAAAAPSAGQGGLLVLTSERYRILLPHVLPGRSYTVRAWARSAVPGSGTAAVVLHCPAQVTAAAVVTFEDPFELTTSLSSEVGVHTLSLPRLTTSELGTTAITIGQPVMAACCVRMLQPGAALELASAHIQTDQVFGLMPVCELGPQLTAHGRPCHVSRGDQVTLLAPICPTRTLDAGRSLGRLQLRWRRLHGGDGAAVKVPDAPGRPSPDPWVTASLELPRVTVSDGLLTARVVAPATVTAGIAFTYSLQVQNFSPAPLELMISLMDSPGFVCSNERSPSVAVPARDSASVVWMLVATMPGHASLPSAKLLVPKHNCALTTQSPHVYVQPF